MVIADSLSTKNDIIKFFNTDPEKVEVIYLAADRIFRKLSENEIDTGILRKYKINKNIYFLWGLLNQGKILML